MLQPSRLLALAHVFRSALLILSIGACAATAALPVKPTFTRVAGTPLEAGGSDDVEARCDLNGDGILDLVTCDRSTGAQNVRVRLGLGDGKFAATTTDLSFGSGDPTSLGLGLLTGGDGRPDIAVAVGGTIRIVANSAGTGGAPQLGQVATLSSPGITLREVEVADVNNDGLSDVIATGSGPNPQLFTEGKVVVFLNTAGGFQTGTVLQTPGGEAGRFAIGDIDGNGALDLAVVNRADNTVAVYMASSPGVFGAPVLRAGQFNEIPQAVALGQIEGDSQLEMVVWRESPLNDGPNYLFGYTVFKHTGSGNFNFSAGTGVNEHAYAAYSGDIAIADMNFDGVNDIIFTDPKAHEVITVASALDSDGNLDNVNSQLRYTSVSNAPKRISIANLNNDTATVNAATLPKLDLVVVVQPVNTNKCIDVFLNGSSGGGGGSNLMPEPLTFTAAKGTTDWLFTAKYRTGLAPGSEVQVQYSLNPDDPSPTWTNIPNGLMAPQNAARTVWTLKSSNFPAGTIAFRVVTSPTVGSTLLPSTSVATKTFTTGRKIDTYVAEVLDIKKQKLGKLKGKGIPFNGTNMEAITKQVDGDQGEFVWFAYTVENTGDVLDTAAISGPASANGFLLTYFNAGMANITSAVTAGTYTCPLGLHGQVRIYLRVRASATLAEDTLGKFCVIARSQITPAVMDFSYGAVEVTKPKNVFFVTTGADNNNNSSPLPGSVREAVGKALLNYKNKSTIKFELPTSGGVPACTLTQDLLPLVVAKNVVIDGTSNADYIEASTGTRPTGPAVNFVGSGTNIGLTIGTTGCRVQGILFSDFNKAILITGSVQGQSVVASGNTVVACEFEGNDFAGVAIEDGAKNNTIGDDDPEEGNIFHSRYNAPNLHGNYGVYVTDYDTTGNKIVGNVIGSTSDDVSRIGGNNSQGFAIAGIGIENSPKNIIGGKAPGAGNYIMGNFGGPNLSTQPGHGILLTGEDTFKTTVQGNTFGRTPSGVYRYNKVSNIAITDGAGSNQIGGSGTGQGNLILNGFNFGLLIDDSEDNRVEGNQIGGPTQDDGNGIVGIGISGGSEHNVIGGKTPGAGNVIMGNGGSDAANGAGIALAGSRSNDIFGNFIGLAKSGPSLGNARGIYLHPDSDENRIGDGTPAARNVISGNFGDAIVLETADENLVYGNFIGTSADGKTVVGNDGAGVLIFKGRENQVGDGLHATKGNTIKGNAGGGVVVKDVASFGNLIRGNDFGINTISLPINLVGGVEDSYGATANDPLDPDSGPNDLQNAPHITATEVVGGKTKITFTFTSTPGTIFYLDIHADGAFVGSTNIRTDAEGDPIGISQSVNGNGSFVLTYDGNLKGKVVTLLVTANRILYGVTSEFSNYAIP